MDIVTRAEAGLREPKHVTHLPANQIKGVAYHYNGPAVPEIANLEDAIRFWVGIQRFHMDQRKWSDIAYSMAVTPTGHIIEGRKFGIRTAANGTNYGNSYYHAVFCMLGEDQKPTPEMLKALDAVHKIHGNGYANAKVGHRNLKATACPGDPIMELWVDRASSGVAGANMPRALKLTQPAMRGDDVERWQRDLNDWVIASGKKLTKLTVDGWFGQKSHDLTIQFQEDRGLTADGIVGPDTAKAMDTAKKKPAESVAYDFPNVVVYDPTAADIDRRLAHTLAVYMDWEVAALGATHTANRAHLIGKSAASANDDHKRRWGSINILSGPNREITEDAVLGFMNDENPFQKSVAT